MSVCSYPFKPALKKHTSVNNFRNAFYKGIFRLTIVSFILFFASGAESFSQVRRFTLLNTTDEHSTLLPLPVTDYHPHEPNTAMGGYPRLATLVREVRESNEDNEPVLLLSTGDILGGTPFAWLTLEGYSAEIEIMKQIGYNAMTIGNHEFDYGPDVLADYFLRAGYPEYNEHLTLIASNLIIPEGHRLLEAGIQENRLFELSNGLTVGVFGLLGKEAYSVASYAEPAEVSDQHQAAARQVSLLRNAGADVVVALTHSGIGEDRDLAADVDGIDVILGGHDHYKTSRPEVINNTIILHTGYYLANLGRLDLEWDPVSGELSVINEMKNAPYLLPLDDSVPEDTVILAAINGYVEKLNRFVSDHTGGMFDDVEDAVMYSDFEMISPGPFVETTVGNFVTDAMRLMTSDITGERVDLSIQGNGIIRADIVPGSMEWSEGKVSFFDLVTVSGLGSGPDSKAGYPLVSFYLTGDEIYNVLEITSLLSQLMGDMYFLQVSGLRYTYDPGRAMWMKIPFLELPVPAYRSVLSAEMYAGEGIQDDDNYVDIDTDRLYHVVTDHYLTSFLPMVGDILPRLKLVLKDKEGNPVHLDQTIITRNGREFKVWEALAQYAVSFEEHSGGLPEVPSCYKNTGGRIVSEEGVPLKVWSYIILVAILVSLILLVRVAVKRIRRRRKIRKS
ncbi:MAG: bifunctional UDP-sugar hydrolase/5'-nucleotidase [Bacteroidales bacterium]